MRGEMITPDGEHTELPDQQNFCSGKVLALSFIVLEAFC